MAQNVFSVRFHVKEKRVRHRVEEESHHEVQAFHPAHLDSIQIVHHDAGMRTTVTIDEDVARMIREAMHRNRKSFKEALNGAVRRGLINGTTQPARKRFVVKASNLGLCPGIDPTSFNKLADQLEDEAIIEKIRKQSKR